MILYALKSGFKNLGAKKLFTFASICTIASSVLVFCMFFVFVSNVTKFIHEIETTIGIQVFFEENLSEDDIKIIANNNFNTSDVKEMRFISSNEAWDKFKYEYFNKNQELANAFEQDNPLAHSASYEILLNDITKQKEYVKYLQAIEGVRQVNYSNVIIEVLTNLNTMLAKISFVLIVILLIIAFILISNTVIVACESRKKENEIMRLIGATNFVIRSPYVIEGFLLGLFGAIIPILLVMIFYNRIIDSLMENFQVFMSLFTPTSLFDIIIPMSIIALSVSITVSVIISFITITRHLKV